MSKAEPTHLNLASMFLAQALRYQNRTALLTKEQGAYCPISWVEFKSNVEKVGVSLKTCGVQKGDRVAILSENCPQWAYADFGILGIGSVTVPLYASFSLRDVCDVLQRAMPKIVFVSTEEQFRKVEPLLGKESFISLTISFQAISVKHPKLLNWSEFIKLVNAPGSSIEDEFKQSVSGVFPDDLATIIYTSGTTGPLKGVMLSHRNFLVNCMDAAQAIDFNDRDLMLSFLPLSHVFERMAGFYFPLMCGSTIAYAENMNSVPQNLLETKPTIACAVPRFYEKMHQRVMEAIDKSPAPFRKLVRWAIQIGYQTIPHRLKKEPLPVALRFQYQIANRLIFRKLRSRLGGRIRLFISGGAPLPKKLGEFFYAMGISILEGYGLTETSPVISVNRLERLKFGTVGILLEQVQVRIDEEGEILVRGPSVMLGYYQDLDATSDAIQDGWLRTGDIGQFDSEGFLVITDRKKDIIVTSGGKNISPQNIENLLLQSRAVRQVVVIGDRHNYLVALIVPNFEFLAQQLGVSNSSKEELISHPRTIGLIRQMADDQTAELANFEKIKYFRLLPQEFSQEKGELTPTLKIKRRVIGERYAALIESMYQEGERKKVAVDDAKE